MTNNMMTRGTDTLLGGRSRELVSAGMMIGNF